jgi:hypothetical protein
MCGTEWTRRQLVKNAAKLGAAAAVSPALLAVTGAGTAHAAQAPRSTQRERHDWSWPRTPAARP